jgi:hypothetical protein
MAQKTTIKAWIVDRNIRKLLPVQKKKCVVQNVNNQLVIITTHYLFELDECVLVVRGPGLIVRMLSWEKAERSPHVLNWG